MSGRFFALRAQNDNRRKEKTNGKETGIDSSEAVLADVGEELGMDYPTLTRCVAFFRAYNIAPGGNNLSWSHYRALLPLTDGAAREW